MVTAAAAIRTFIAGRTLGDYQADLMLRSAVERQFEILGEALTRALRVDPGLKTRLPASRGAIDFRNVIAHEYDALAAATVWDIACNELPGLAADAASELARLDAERPWPASPAGPSTPAPRERAPRARAHSVRATPANRASP